MDRTVPQTGSEEIELYMRTYYSLLRSSDSIKIETLVESHLAMRSSLHEHAAAVEPDASALMYSALRLPACVIQTKEVLIGQMERAFVAAGYRNIGAWQRVFATGRRRRTHFDGADIMAVYVVSRSDIDDLVPILTAFKSSGTSSISFCRIPNCTIYCARLRTRARCQLKTSPRLRLACAWR